MLDLEFAPQPYDQELYLNALPGGDRGTACLGHFSGRMTGVPGSVAGFVITGDLQGRCLDGEQSLLGVGIAQKLPSRHAQQGLPPPSECVALLSGDFYADPSAAVRGASGDVRPVWAAFDASCARVVGVAGNHDTWEGPPLPPPFLDGQMVVIDGLRIAGLSGIVGANGKIWRRPLPDYLETLRLLLRVAPHIVVLHESPLDLGRSATRRGKVELLEVFLEAGFDGVVISGHVGWHEPLVRIGQAKFLNAHERVISLVCTWD